MSLLSKLMEWIFTRKCDGCGERSSRFEQRTPPDDIFGYAKVCPECREKRWEEIITRDRARQHRKMVDEELMRLEAKAEAQLIHSRGTDAYREPGS